MPMGETGQLFHFKPQIQGNYGSYHIFSNGMELDLLVVSHENTVEFAALTMNKAEV
jgi:hypothetical protein